MNKELKASVARIGVAAMQAHQDYMDRKIDGVDAVVILHRAVNELIRIRAGDKDVEFLCEMADEVREKAHREPIVLNDTWFWTPVDPTMTVDRYAFRWAASRALADATADRGAQAAAESDRAFAALEIMDCGVPGNVVPPYASAARFNWEFAQFNAKMADAVIQEAA